MFEVIYLVIEVVSGASWGGEFRSLAMAEAARELASLETGKTFMVDRAQQPIDLAA